MNERESKKNKHMSMEERQEIQECLDKGMTFKAIARRIGKDQTTVSREVKRHIVVRAGGNMNIPDELCPNLRKAPFVCNPCQKRHGCRRTKHFYFAKKAQSDYESLLVECRTGIPLNKEQFYINEQIITDGIKRGQHLYHILQNNDLGVSKSTVYRHIQKGYMSVAPIDLPRMVKFKPRRQHAREFVPTVAKKGRTYSDFLDYCQEMGMTTWVEMDTVIGRVGGKVILTLDFTFCNFMAGFLLENKSAAEVTRAISELKQRLTENDLSFGRLFPVILTDNGGEFSNVAALENSPDGAKETSLFFCDPCKSYQKPHVENTHTMFRNIVPQGKSFDGFTQDMVSLIFSHVNGVSRMSLGGRTAYEMFTFTFGVQAASALGINRIDARDVMQTPALVTSDHK